MRSSGVPNFPDPTFGAAAHQKIAGGPNGLDPQAPAFRHALASCGGKGNRVEVSAP
jgi:hypothetical protein